MFAANIARLCKRSRCGSTYLTVLASSMIVMTIGLASLYAIRVQRRAAQIARDCAEARLCAQAAVELGLLFIVQDPNWRHTWPNGTWRLDRPLGSGTYTLQGIDPRDGSLANSQYDPLVLTGVGTKGLACHKTQVTLVPQIEPLEALRTCLHASGQLSINGGKQITVVGGAISTNGLLDNDGIIDGDAEAARISHAGTITGQLTVPAATKQMPGEQVISQYISKATIMALTGTIDKAVLTPSYNPWGPTNADGVYCINAGSDLTIKNSRIYGTLIVVCTPGKKLTLDNALFMQNYRPDYPVLIVEGDVVIRTQSCDYPLSEPSNNTNYNPSGAPYLGQWDSDVLDEYPNEIRGLVHIKGSLKLQQTARLYGAVICKGPVSCEEQNTIVRNTDLYTSPPEGYTFVDHMKISPGGWKQVAN